MYSVELGVCGNDSIRCGEVTESAQMLLGIFPMVFLLSLITYKLHEEVFITWRRFGFWFVPISILLILSSSSGGGGWGVGFGNEQEILAIFFPVLYAVTSLTLIAYKSSQLRGK